MHTEAKREQWAQIVHDGITQHAMALRIGLASLAKRLPTDGQAADLLALSEDLIAAARHLSSKIRPGVFSELGLAEAVRSQAAGAQIGLGIPVRCEVANVPAEAMVAAIACRVAEESLANVRHAQASAVTVQLRASQPATFELSLADDGCGFDPGRIPAGGLGLFEMRELVTAAGGALEIESRPGRGTQVRAILPLAGGAR